jgi:plasmid stability protein
MARLTIENVPENLRARLEKEASANLRTIEEEALAWLEWTLGQDALFSTARDQRWIDEALASGPAKPFDRGEFQRALQRGLERAKGSVDSAPD